MRFLTVGGPQPHVGTQVLEKGVEGGDEVLEVQGGGVGGEGGGVGRNSIIVLLPTLKSLIVSHQSTGESPHTLLHTQITEPTQDLGEVRDVPKIE